MTNEERLLRQLAEAGGCMCAASLNQQERATAESLTDLGMARYDIAVVLTERGLAMVESLKVN